MPKSIEQARANLEASLGAIPNRYKAGVEAAEWMSAAASDAAEANFASGVSEAVTSKARQRGIRAAGEAAYKEGALSKGVQTIATQLRANLDKYATNFSRPYQAVLGTLKTLPPRGTDAAQNIDTRLKPIVAALQRAKKG